MTLQYIIDRFKPDMSGKSPYELPFSRHGLAQLFAELGFKTIVEIGVERALFTRVLARANPQAIVYAVDAWQAYKGYRDHVSQTKLDDFYELTKERLAAFPNVRIIRGFSMDVVKQFENESLDAIYIDSAHDFQTVTNDICEWGKKVRRGGLISGHDYANLTRGGQALMHVKQVVDAYTRCYDIRPYFTTNNLEGSGHTNRSFIWVKQ